MMQTYLDLVSYENFDSKYLVLINHITTRELSIVGCDYDDELDYLGCFNLDNLPIKLGFTFTDDEGEEHEITILHKN